MSGALQTVSAILSLVISVGTVLFVTLPQGRKVLVTVLTKDHALKEEIGKIREILTVHTAEDELKKEEIKLQKEVDRCVLRDLITSIYYQYVKEKKIPVFAMEDVTALYELYKKRGGNSYVQSLMRQILEEWEVIF